MNELIQQLVSQLGVNPDQAKGGAGLLFKMVQSKLGGDFSKVAQAMPEVTGLIKAAPAEGGADLRDGLRARGGALAELRQPVMDEVREQVMHARFVGLAGDRRDHARRQRVEGCEELGADGVAGGENFRPADGRGKGGVGVRLGVRGAELLALGLEVGEGWHLAGELRAG